MKNDVTTGAMNLRGESDCELRSIVNPHDVPRPKPLDQRTEDAPYDPAMKKPRQVGKVSPQAFQQFHAGEQLDRFRRSIPRVICGGADNHGMRCVPKYVGGPA